MGLNSLVMSGRHIGKQAGGFEPQRQNNGLLWIEGLQAFGDVGAEGNTSIVTLALEQFPFPKVRQDAIELPFLNTTQKVAGDMKTEDMEVTIRDFVDKPVLLVLQNWRNAVGDPVEGRIGLAADYKKTAFVNRYSPDGKTCRVYKLEGVWPQIVDPGDHDMGSPEKTLIQMTLSVDRAYPVMDHATGQSVVNWGGQIRWPLRSGGALNQAIGAAQTLLGALG